MSEANEQPIVIKRIKKSGHSAHGGAWKVAFADFMTAMMAFFLTMWLVGQTPEVRQSVAGYFRDPGKFQEKGGAGLLQGSKSPTKSNEADKAKISLKKQENEKSVSQDKKQLSLAAKRIMDELANQPVFGQLKKNIKIQMTSEGLRIILNESEDAPAFFEPGSAKLLQKSAIILVTIAKELATLDNRLVIEGHTDAGFSGNSSYSNWELSADRANSARQLMEVSGLWDGQVREVRGFADKFPMLVDHPEDPRNRRVSLVVLYQEKERQYDEIEVGDDLMAQVD